MNRLFENFERIDIQAIRKQYKEEGLEEGLKEGREEGLKEGREEGLKEGREEGQEMLLVKQTCNSLKKGLSTAQIADLLCAEETHIKAIVDAAGEFAPDYDVDKIVKKLMPAMSET